jgi:hypothetical protein
LLTLCEARLVKVIIIVSQFLMLCVFLLMADRKPAARPEGIDYDTHPQSDSCAACHDDGIDASADDGAGE